MTDTAEKVRASMFVRENGVLLHSEKTCARGHRYDQMQISKDWLFTQPAPTQARYERICEVRDGKYLIPRMCPVCVRVKS